MAGEEDQPEHVVLDVVDEGVEIGHGRLLPLPVLFQGVAELRRTTSQGVGAPEVVDGASLGGLHEPGRRVVGDTLGRPLLQGGDQGVLGEVLGQAEIARHPGERTDEPGRLVTPHLLDDVLGGPGLAHTARLGPPGEPAAVQAPVGASSGSAIRRISIAPSQPGQCWRCRSAIFWPSSRASSSLSNLTIAQPPMTSLASA